MKIGIIVYSQSGNTLSVAEKVKEKVTAKGHKVSIEKVEITGEEGPQFQISAAPDVGGYEAVIFGSSVRAFSLSPVMAAYMGQVGALGGKKVALFITKGLKGAWTGGNGALKKLKELCEGKGGQVTASGMVIWPDKNREQSIESLAEDLAKAF